MLVQSPLDTLREIGIQKVIMVNKWGVQDDIKVLRRDGYNSAANRLEILSTAIDKDVEMQSIINFIREHPEVCPSNDILGREQLRALWIAFCFHQDLDVDTYEYDAYLSTLWGELTSRWPLDEFEEYMCAMLV